MGMIPVKCPDCGADIELDDSREFGFCNYCGTKVMQDKVVVEHKGSVKVDHSDELNNLYQLARRAKNDNNSENAQKYYEQILVKDPDSWEANFYSVYYQSMNCKIANIQSAAIRITNCEDTVLKLINNNIKDKDEQKKAVNEMSDRCILISSMLFNGAKNHFDGIDAQIKSRFVQEYIDRVAASKDICYNLGNYIESIFGEEFGSIAASCWKTGINQHKQYVSRLQDKTGNVNIINKYSEKVKKYDSSFVTPEINTGGCYVATAVYGSYDCPQVWTLRRYRDNQLAKTWYGRLFIHTYYAISPTLVKWFGETQWFKNMWRPKLDSMVKNLKESGFESTPYEDREW